MMVVKKAARLLCMICVFVFAAGCDDAPRAQSGGNIDVDLTRLNPMMTFAQVQNMMTRPQNFAGKTIKARGIYDAWFHDGTGRHHHFVVVSDAAGCCPAGLEFTVRGERKFPYDFPEVGSTVEITGVFGSYVYEDHTYYHITANGVTAVGR